MREVIDDSAFLADCLLRENAAPLGADDHPSALTHAQAMHLIALGGEAVRLRGKLAGGPRRGPRGRLMRAGLDDRGQHIAAIVLDSEDDLARAGALLTAPISIEAVDTTPRAANEDTHDQGQGSFENEGTER